MNETILGFCFFGIYFLSVALPLVVAVLIFKIFPDTKVGLRGPLQGLTVNATGAFAAFVITFLMIIHPTDQLRREIYSLSSWKVEFDLLLFDVNGKKLPPKLKNGDVDITFQPSTTKVYPRGDRSAVSIDLLGIDLQWPTIVVDVKGFDPQNFNPSTLKEGADYIWNGDTIKVLDPLTFRKQLAPSTYKSKEYINRPK